VAPRASGTAARCCDYGPLQLTFASVCKIWCGKSLSGTRSFLHPMLSFRPIRTRGPGLWGEGTGLAIPGACEALRRRGRAFLTDRVRRSIRSAREQSHRPGRPPLRAVQWRQFRPEAGRRLNRTPERACTADLFVKFSRDFTDPFGSPRRQRVGRPSPSNPRCRFAALSPLARVFRSPFPTPFRRHSPRNRLRGCHTAADRGGSGGIETMLAQMQGPRTAQNG